MLDLDVIYCFIDDFCKDFMPQWEHHLIETGLKKRNKLMLRTLTFKQSFLSPILVSVALNNLPDSQQSTVVFL